MKMASERGIQFRERNPRPIPYNGTDDLEEFLNRKVCDTVFAPRGLYRPEDISFLLVVCQEEENSDLYGEHLDSRVVVSQSL